MAKLLGAMAGHLPSRPSTDYHVLDSHIAQLVHSMNLLTGIETIGSCQGHFSGRRAPYVYFKAPVGLVEQAEAALRQAQREGQLNFFWRIEGAFDENCRLTFLLRSPELEKKLFKGWWPPFVFWFGRRAIDQDFESIGALLSTCI